jgi:hypothetical protein
MMSVAMALVALAGLSFALFFKVPALAAATFLVAVTAAVVWVQQSWPLMEGLAKVLGLILVLQASYLLGLRLEFVTRPLRRRWIEDRKRNTS